MKTKYTGPLIGIMTGRKANGRIAGNGPLFIELQKKLISLGGISFVFIPDEVEDDTIIGYRYSPTHHHWTKEKFPYPDLVYNRIPFRKFERNELCQHFFSILREKNIPYFNPCFIDKYELYTLLNNHPILQHYLPQTILIEDKKELVSFIQKFQSIYLKPTQSSQGKGILRLRLKNPSSLLVEGVDTKESYQSLHHFWEDWNKELLEKHYLAQEEIKAAEFEGDRFDFRLLVHAEYNDYLLTGVGIRQSQRQTVTTHIPSGGKLLPYSRLQTTEHDEFIQTIVPSIGKALSDEFGYFGEFSVDAGVSKTGQYYIYEVNSKPMSFDEAEIEERKIEQLCRLFLQSIYQN